MMMSYTVYLIGYGNQTEERFMERLTAGVSALAARRLVIDIRASRTSWCRAYQAPAVEWLFHKCGFDYMWLIQLGNRWRNGHEVELVDEQVGMLALEAQVRTPGLAVVLLCAERDSRECHRSYVAERLRERLAQAGDSLTVRWL